ncbi:2-oxoglutarate dehydrogenase complex dihydrolipoyllysine-residue succinyltransferase [Roseitalea porphyridii]|uniref:Dihydrolipoyllysine-residue succinyltransferase component of 2-oxoglutarate dehydrogenase complex n=1 Tax=Roseitalea porphyridii TaxID=1852022 RepID=A0A4V1A3H8_9HYPH|nr:2-oxoglutarate dehydrogenase complex dihydrolipoyllysine-residue succinyltransferase [Roseitalea porphyridii]QBK29168.1 2-oxoglutarate dehydrogenase complex dihydrolipoyllysine-residue succinyltransferase [Roseitalea porphyridii]
MSKEIRVPTLGESVTEATIGQWFKKPGDTVSDGETLVELETDKVTLEVPSPGSGTLAEIAANEGDTVEVDALLGTLTEGEGAPAKEAPTKETPAPSGSEAESPGMKEARDEPQPIGDHGAEPENFPGKTDMQPSPAAAKLIDENDLDASNIGGSGKRGQVLKSDVLDAIAKGTGAPSEPAETPKVARAPSAQEDQVREERVRMTKLRQTIARRLKDAQNTAAMLTTYNEVDMSAVMAMRSKYKDLFEKKHDVKLGFMGFFTRAVCHALKEIPSVNAEIDGTDIIYKNYAHIGVAVGTDKGLVVPVVRDADRMSIAEVELEIGRLGRAARDGNLSMADMQGGTFTISNGGVYGSLMSSPILNAPQSGILGMHKIQERPVALNGEVVIRPMMYLALSYDHRIVDGKEAVTFLVRVKESLEDPERFVLDL